MGSPGRPGEGSSRRGGSEGAGAGRSERDNATYKRSRSCRRVADAFTLNLGVLLSVATAGVSLMLLLVSGLSYQRLRSLRLLFAGGAFLVLAIKGVLHAWRGVVRREVDLADVVLDAAILAFLYASVAKR